MRISVEIFGIPEESVEALRRTVYDSFERFLFRNNSKESDAAVSIRGGTCPLSGRAYMNVTVQAAHPVDLQSLNLFTDTLYAAHPLRDDDLVRTNRFVRVEDSPCGNGHPEDDSELEDGSADEDEISCWICGRFDGEEYREAESGDTAELEVRVDRACGVPLCRVCARILKRSTPIE